MSLLQENFSENIVAFLSEQDDAPPHIPELAQNLFIQENIRLPQWSAQQPRSEQKLNVWLFVNNKPSNDAQGLPINKYTIIQRVHEVWAQVPQDFIHRFCTFTPRRLEAVQKTA